MWFRRGFISLGCDRVTCEDFRESRPDLIWLCDSLPLLSRRRPYLLPAADAVRAATAIGDPESQLLADSAQAAANAIAEPTQGNRDNFVALAQQRASGLSPRALTDERDLVALATRLPPTTT